MRYEDTEVGGANPLAVGLIIEQIAAKSTNQDWVCFNNMSYNVYC